MSEIRLYSIMIIVHSVVFEIRLYSIMIIVHSVVSEIRLTTRDISDSYGSTTNWD